jgi:hypothetical protein
LYRFDGISGFPLAEYGGMPLGSVPDGNDVTFRLLDPDLVWLVVGIFRLFLTVQKLFDFSITIENAL